MKLISYILLLFAGIVSTADNFAQTWVPSFFSDNMVLQQNDAVKIWGKDAPGTTITARGDWGKAAVTVTDDKGNWQLKLATTQAGGPYNLLIKGSKELRFANVLLGEVWFCSGQSNMEMPVKGFSGQPVIGSNEAILQSENTQIRFFGTPKKASITPVSDIKNNWAIAAPATTGNFSAAAYFFAKKIQSVLKVPIGIIQSSWGASTIESWMDRESLSPYTNIIIPDTLPAITPNREPTIMFNSMLSPYIGYTIKGVLWYQGEANRDNAFEYQSLFTSMIALWRNLWKQGTFPFYFVQIAPFEMGKSNAALLREAQLKTMQTVANTGMAVTLDIGDRVVIHPSQKEQVGHRLAYWALAKTYNIKGIAFSGPVVKNFTQTKEGKMMLTFDYCENGLSGFGKPLTHFEIAGEDRVFYPATAVIQNNNPKTITVWNDNVKNPVSVRYAFKNWAEASLFNTEGLPASSFRTDNW